MREKQFYGVDERRGKVFGRFYREGQSPLKVDLISVEELKYKPTKRGKILRSNVEKENHLKLLYDAKQRELDAKQKTQSLNKNEGLLIQDAMQLWLDHVAAFRDSKTAVKYRFDASRWVQSCGNYRIQSPPAKTAEKYIDFLRREGLSDASINSALRSIRVFLNWAVDNHHIQKAPKITSLRVTKKQPRIYTSEQLQNILDRINNEIETVRIDRRQSKICLRRVFYMMRYTGMRNAEVRNLLWSDILDTQIRLRDNEDGQHKVKGRQEAFVPISEILRGFLMGEEKNGEIYYLDDGKGRQQWNDECGLTRAMRRLLDRIGITDVKPLHSFRATVATELLSDPNTNAFLVQQLLRHQDIQTTLGYANTSQLETSALINKLPQMSMKCR